MTDAARRSTYHSPTCLRLVPATATATEAGLAVGAEAGLAVGAEPSAAVTGMRFRALRSNARRAVRELDTAVGIPRPFDLDTLLDRLEQQRGKPIDLHETPTLGGQGPCGLWIQQADRDVIAFAADTSAVHQSHIILHELGHMIAGHQENCVLEVHTVSALVPLVPARLVEHMFARSSYAATEEQEAELIACLIRLTADEQPGSRPTPGNHPGGPDADYLTRLAQVFGD